MRQIWIGMAVLGLSLLTVLFGAPSAQAAAQQPFTLRPGGVATITFVAYCTEFGKFFPQTIVEPDGRVAQDQIRAVLSYIDQQGYSADEAQALEANIAIWELAGATRAPAGGDITRAVIANATTAPANPAGTSIFEAAAMRQVRIALASWAPIGDKVQILRATDHFYGQGTLTIENTSAQTLELYMPVGTLFPGNEARFQQVGGFATDVQVRNPELPATSGIAAPPFVLLLSGSLVLMAGGVHLRRRMRDSAPRRRCELS